MRFQAKLLGVPGLERPQQTFSNSMEDIRQWACDTMRLYRKGRTVQQQSAIQVEVNESRPVLVARLQWNDVVPEAERDTAPVPVAEVLVCSDKQ